MYPARKYNGRLGTTVATMAQLDQLARAGRSVAVVRDRYILYVTPAVCLLNRRCADVVQLLANGDLRTYTKPAKADCRFGKAPKDTPTRRYNEAQRLLDEAIKLVVDCIYHNGCAPKNIAKTKARKDDIATRSNWLKVTGCVFTEGQNGGEV